MDEVYSDDDTSAADGRTNRAGLATFRRAASVVIFIGLVGLMGLWAYRLGTRDASEVPIIKAMQGPTRIEPEIPGGLQAANKGHEINKVLEGGAAPAPRDPIVLEETPQLAEEDRPQPELELALRAPDETANPGDREAELGALVAEAIANNEATAPGDLVKPAPDLGGSPLVAGDVEELAAEEDEASEPEVAALSGPRPVSRPANLVRVRAKPTPVATPKTVPVRSAPAPQAAAAAPQIREVNTLSSGSRLVQLGAYDSDAVARHAWRKLVAANSDLLSSKSLYIERATSNARVFYRLRVAGFSNTDQTRDLCEALRARSIDCIPVTLR
jgi:hypothetical protein